MPGTAKVTRARWAARVLLPVACILFVLFIFYNSSQTGAVSGAVSGEITALLSGSSAPTKANEMLETVVRKLGHIGEYALLGALLFAAAAAWTRRRAAKSRLPRCMRWMTGN